MCDYNQYVLDNDCSTQLKELIRDTCKLELMSPGCHRSNMSEVAIKGFKQHFLGILAGLPDNFPWWLWNRLLPQTETTLNLLHQSNATPTVSAYAHMYSNFDYNRMLLAPMRCPYHSQVHVKPDKQKTWDFHTLKVSSHWAIITVRTTYLWKIRRPNDCQIQSLLCTEVSPTQ